MNINELIEQRVNIKSQIDELRAQEKDLQEQLRANESILLKELDTQGLSRTANDIATVSISETTVPEVTDWNEIDNHAIATGDMSFYQRRLSAKTCNEYWQLGGTIPGVQPRTFRKINMRKL